MQPGHATEGWSRRFTGEVIGRDQLELWARGLDHFMAVRARHDQAKFCDVWYDDFVADPIGTIESVYGRFGLALSGPAADAMRAVQAASAEAGGQARGTAGNALLPHQYALADFGLTAERSTSASPPISASRARPELTASRGWADQTPETAKG